MTRTAERSSPDVSIERRESCVGLAAMPTGVGILSRQPQPAEHRADGSIRNRRIDDDVGVHGSRDHSVWIPRHGRCSGWAAETLMDGRNGERGWWSTLGGEARAIVTAAPGMPLGALVRDDAIDPEARHPTPVLFIHVLFGHASNFSTFRTVLRARGVGNFASFSYRPRLDYQRLAAPRIVWTSLGS
jgi:hypothetical protein